MIIIINTIYVYGHEVFMRYILIKKLKYNFDYNVVINFY